jgi:hypothetical protein
LRGRCDAALDDARLLEFLEASREHVRGDARKPVEQVGIATRPYREVADYEQCPPFADQFEGAGETAVLSEITALHSLSVAKFS